MRPTNKGECEEIVRHFTTQTESLSNLLRQKQKRSSEQYAKLIEMLIRLDERKREV